ncbi:MAG TPA: hypothetical protein VLN45_11310 [Ignavibacteriaceae bacterium]|nr:hypothetical protein [Ignavibacteriaceae bacterium]
MFTEIENGTFASIPFIYKINPALYKFFTLHLIQNKNLFKELKKNNLMLDRNDNEELNDILKSFSSELIDLQGNELDKNKILNLICYEQFFKELGAGLKFSPVADRESTNMFLRNTQRLLEEYDSLIEPMVIFKKVNAIFKESGVELLEFNTFLPGKKFSSFLYNPELKKDFAAEIILYIVTIGRKADDKIKFLLSKEEMVDAYTLNAIMGAAAEMVAFDFNNYANENFLIGTDMKYKRFSPGYGDLNLNVQKILFDILKPQKIIDVELSGENLIIPEKSTSGIMYPLKTVKNEF